MNPVWYALLWRPNLVARRLDQLAARGVDVPNLWQLWLGSLYMAHRVATRPETIGVSETDRVRQTARARLLRIRPLRAPFLLGRRVNPLDTSGLGSSPAHLARHVLGAYHPGGNATYDLQILGLEGRGALEALRTDVAAVVDGTHPNAAFLRDLVVYEGYHEALLARLDGWLASTGEPADLDHAHADTTLTGFLAWCRRQPATPRATLRAALRGGLDFSPRAEAT